MTMTVHRHTPLLRLLAGAATLLVAACSSVSDPAPGKPADKAPEKTASAAPADAPPQTQIFLASLDLNRGTVGTPRPITSHPGYNNQPSFLNDGSGLLFVSNRSGSINVFRYIMATGATSAVTSTTENLYSPQELPDGGGFSAVRVITPNANGAEAKEPPVWRYGWDGQPAAPMTDVRVVGYYAFVNERLAAFFVVDSDATRNANKAVLADRVTGQTRVMTDKPGRSLGRTPDGRRASFVDKTDPQRWVVAAMGADDAKPVVLVATPTGPAGEPEADRSEDYAWMPDGSLLMARGSQFLRWNGQPGSGFQPFADVGNAGGAIKRLAVSRDGRQLAFVVQAPSRPPTTAGR
jgi:dipeptidyl aminopeptidase/acylaminoacyl peptidase